MKNQETIEIENKFTNCETKSTWTRITSIITI